MNGPTWLLTLVVSCLTDFIISAGGCLTTAMVATGSTTMPSGAVMAFSIVTGLIAAARGARALLAQPPGSSSSQTPLITERKETS